MHFSVGEKAPVRRNSICDPFQITLPCHDREPSYSAYQGTRLSGSCPRISGALCKERVLSTADCLTCYLRRYHRPHELMEWSSGDFRISSASVPRMMVPRQTWTPVRRHLSPGPLSHRLLHCTNRILGDRT
ncbi:hypothetical protein CY34DRAFT_226794 [Suillus luteus UH-Slu-Lm8-n1]|uniref:Uncharacterized protein n=1 Tax=Suillus luteus UH-Slu-Lm8-n1 TaxID=930992 RepID=A0A0C9ZT97_9AGAM|nr:hypothetical protein CY34DRAFT_226794 [Suillus luteus UH-Slu-Lm8-n1]